MQNLLCSLSILKILDFDYPFSCTGKWRFSTIQKSNTAARVLRFWSGQTWMPWWWTQILILSRENKLITCARMKDTYYACRKTVAQFTSVYGFRT
ncbi:hypothetical protein SUGI_0814700 [Cryptomeria japonica]|nr:hypothetical protein SUGI_0814700 [Cryptomeria japonica]